MRRLAHALRTSKQLTWVALKSIATMILVSCLTVGNALPAYAQSKLESNTSPNRKYPKLLSYQDLMRLSPAKREKYLEGVQRMMKEVARLSKSNRTGLFTEVSPQAQPWQFALIEFMLSKSEANVNLYIKPYPLPDAALVTGSGIANKNYRPIIGAPERLQGVLLPGIQKAQQIDTGNTPKNLSGHGGAPPPPKAAANAPPTICKPPAILYNGTCAVPPGATVRQPNKAKTPTKSAKTVDKTVQKSLRPPTHRKSENTAGSNVPPASRPEAQGQSDVQLLATSIPEQVESLAESEVDASVEPTSSGGRCAAVTYQCLARDSDEFQRIRRDFYDPKKDHASKCVFTGNFSTYQDGIRAAGRCLPPKDFCFNRKDPSSCRSQSGDRMACDGPREAICNPLVFGLQQNGKPFCVDSGNGATASCDAASTPQSRTYDFLNQDMPGIQEAWNQFRREFDTLCAGNPGAESGDARPASNHVFVLNCNECNLISVRLSELNEMVGVPCSGEGTPAPGEPAGPQPPSKPSSKPEGSIS